MCYFLNKIFILLTTTWFPSYLTLTFIQSFTTYVDRTKWAESYRDTDTTSSESSELNSKNSYISNPMYRGDRQDHI